MKNSNNVDSHVNDSHSNFVVVIVVAAVVVVIVAVVAFVVVVVLVEFNFDENWSCYDGLRAVGVLFLTRLSHKAEMKVVK